MKSGDKESSSKNFLDRCEDHFYQLGEKLIQSLNLNEEHLTLSVQGESAQFIRINSSLVRQSGMIEDAFISLTYIFNHRTSTATFPFTADLLVDFQSSFAALEQMRIETANLPEDPYVTLPKNYGSSRSICSGELLPAELAQDTILQPLQNEKCTGIYSSGQIFRGSMNSAGQRHWFLNHTFSFDASLQASNEKMLKLIYAGKDFNVHEYTSYLEEARKNFRILETPPVKVKPNHYRTYFSPHAVAEIINMFSWHALSESDIQQGQSAFQKMRRDHVCLSPLFSLSEDFRVGSVPKFNSLGEISSDVIPLIQNGLLKNTLISSRTAEEYALCSNFAEEGEPIRSPVMQTGNLERKDILKTLGTGLYLSNLHYLNWSDLDGGRITGMTRYACFWVEDGEIVAPIENLRFDDTIYRFFGDELEAVTNFHEFIPDVSTYGGRSLGGVVAAGMIVNAFAFKL